MNPEKIKFFHSPYAGAKKGNIPWNKGLHGDPRLKPNAKTKKLLSEKCTGLAKTEDAEKKRRVKLRAAALKNKLGGYQKGSGRGKKGTYKGFYCDSSWELAYVIYHLDHSLHIIRNTEKREYEFEGVVRKYIPDFIVDNTLVEIKGYVTEQWEAKKLANPDIKVLYAKDMEIYLSYVRKVYGNNFISMYE